MVYNLHKEQTDRLSFLLRGLMEDLRKFAIYLSNMERSRREWAEMSSVTRGMSGMRGGFA
jgi:hypothetical protein